jgi:Kdo2-lipid IVA lauroyltransferase/acyltransferase
MWKVNLSSFLQSRFNIFIFNKMGWALTYAYIYLLGKIYFFFKRTEKNNIAAALAEVYSGAKSLTEIQTVTKKVFMGILSHYYEKVFNAFSDAETLRAFFGTHVSSEGLTALDEGLSGGKGVLLVTGHVGGVEFIPLYLGAKKYPVTMIVRFSTERLREMSFKQADRFSVRIIDAGTTPNIMKAISSNLKENRIVITQCDEMDEWRHSAKEKIFFLGRQTRLDKTLNVLSKRMAAPIVFGTMHRGEDHRYTFIATSCEEMTRRHQRSADTSIGEVLLKFLEQYIYRYPEGWYQWKKYGMIESLATPGRVTDAPASIQMLEPSMGNVA